MATKKDVPKQTGEKKSPDETTPGEQPVSKASPRPDRLNANCKCKQKRNGKFYCFKLQQGRWVQASGFPFETQEDCEMECCEE